MRIIILLITLLITGHTILHAQYAPRKDSTAIPQEEKEWVFTKVELEPCIPGGIRAWPKYLRDELIYPRKARKKGIEGDVVIRFIMNKYSTLTDITPLSGDPILITEAIRLIKKSGKWIPATQSGREVKAYKTEIIQFKIK